jgi:Putative auto-transporter adhesin, head GIN domain
MGFKVKFLYLRKLTAMKQVIFLLFTLFTIASCRYTTGSGNVISETRPAGNFDAISVGGGFEVEVKIGPVTSVLVEADDNIMKYIEIKTVGSTLKIGTEDLHNYSDVHMKVFITTPSLNTIKASASADVVVKDVMVSTGKITLKATSSSSIKTEVNAPEIESDANSSATINVQGKTKNYDADASSSADINSFDLLSENTTAKASSSATVRVYASVSLNASASSSGDIEYKGAATVNPSTSSSGSITKK